MTELTSIPGVPLLDFTPMRRQRRLLEVSQRELGAAVGVSGAMVYCYEKGRSLPNAAQLVGLAQALGVPIHSLFTARPASK